MITAKEWKAAGVPWTLEDNIEYIKHRWSENWEHAVRFEPLPAKEYGGRPGVRVILACPMPPGEYIETAEYVIDYVVERKVKHETDAP